ncbi:hypothetical protein BKA80DRAFT_70114 [Phyllosticta citrichinensis]
MPSTARTTSTRACATHLTFLTQAITIPDGYRHRHRHSVTTSPLPDASIYGTRLLWRLLLIEAVASASAAPLKDPGQRRWPAASPHRPSDLFNCLCESQEQSVGIGSRASDVTCRFCQKAGPGVTCGRLSVHLHGPEDCKLKFLGTLHCTPPFPCPIRQPSQLLWFTPVSKGGFRVAIPSAWEPAPIDLRGQRWRLRSRV